MGGVGLVRASVVIPAHNESGVIGRCLQSLVGQGDLADLEVVVVANGCVDDTAARARSFSGRIPGLVVVEHARAGKVGALNEGDRVCSSWPRIYVDADVEFADGALAPLVEALSTAEPRIAAPRVLFRSESSARSVRAWYDVFKDLPYAADNLVGLGVYGMSQAGRARFDAFPEVIADDLFAQRLFRPDERVVTDHGFFVFVPHNLRSLVAVRTRVASGNTQLAGVSHPHEHGAFDPSTGSTTAALLRMAVGQPHRLLAVAVYVGVGLVARRRARRPQVGWQRDQSSRSATETPPGTHPRVPVDGVPFDAVTEKQAVEHVLAEIGSGQGGLLVTPNTDILRQLRHDHPEIKARSSLVVADGMPVVWASRLQGTGLPARVTGADLVWSLSRGAGRQSLSLFLLGAAPGVADLAAQRLLEASPGLSVAGTYSPELGFASDPAALAAVLKRVVDTEPDLVFVALGFPLQEQIGLALIDALPAAWVLGCGGALDMAAGNTERAPARLQKVGGEWLHRLRLEPRRLARRYLVDDLPYAAGLMGRAMLARARGR